MRTVELFCGTKSFSKVAAERGHSTFTVDNDARFGPDRCADIMAVDPSDPLVAGADFLWASPPCQGFSVAVIGRNWNRDCTPKSDSARLAMGLAMRTLAIIGEARPRLWAVENPRGMLRKMPWMDEFLKTHGGTRHTVSYCQYGDTRQKPTDIWTNVPPAVWTPRPICKPGSPCHEAAPRGSRTGTQGLKGAIERGAIPPALFHEILAAAEGAMADGRVA